ncbi:NADP-dependent oxidoreductase [uncultured Flavobacterium sp.]|jgi:NADPH-dependent curcumin reductase|uniref:NADP-dependent oxidoreductase n=1 Tax=uncultured Flavobacterium sp. TaxID=165435 RepID=UPI0030CA4B31
MNKQVLLAQRPDGLPTKSTWIFQEVEIQEPKEGEVVIKQHYISLDPAMRGWMRDGKSYIEPVVVGDVMRAGTVGEVIKAHNHPKFKVGDFISGWGGVQQFTTTNAKGYHKIDPTIAPLPMYLGTMGMPGMTAYFGILKVGELKEGDIVLVSGAAGAVGSLVGQIAKIKGCRVVGIAGGKDKCDYLVNELGFDAAIDYKSENIYSGLKKHCPDGIDIFFDNVGGEILDAALLKLRMHARVVICGAISQYNVTEKPKGPGNYMSLLVNRATMKGMVVFDYAKQYDEAIIDYLQWMKDGKLKSNEDIYDGIENFHETFLRLFSGNKLGKLILKVLE